MEKTSSASPGRFEWAAFGSAFLVQEAFVGPIMVVFYINYIGLAFSEMTLFFSIIIGSKLLCSFPAGYIADKIGRKRLLLIGQALGVMTMSAIFLLRFHRSMPLLFGLGLSWAAARAIDSVTFMPTLFDMAHRYGVERDLGEILARRTGIGASVTGLAVVGSGFIATRGVQYSFTVDIAIAATALLFFAAFLDESTDASGAKGRWRNHQTNSAVALDQHRGGTVFLKIFPTAVFAGLFLASQRAAFNYLQPALSFNGVPLPAWGLISALLFFISYWASLFYRGRDGGVSVDRLFILACIGLAAACVGSLQSRNPCFAVLFLISANALAPALVARSTQFVMHHLEYVKERQSSSLATVAIVQTSMMAAALGVTGYVMPPQAYDRAIAVASAFAIGAVVMVRSCWRY